MAELLNEYGRRRAVVSSITDWSGASARSRALDEHASLSQHHITISASDTSATGVLRIRLRPTKLPRQIAVNADLEAINLALVGGSASFIISGFFDLIVVDFTTALSAGTVDVVIASTGEHLASYPVAGTREHGRKAPPLSMIADGWDGSGSVSVNARAHGGSGLHHIALTCSTTPSAGIVYVQGMPLRGKRFVNLGRFSLTDLASINAIVVGFFEQFRIVPEVAITGAGTIHARVQSAGEDLSEVYAWLPRILTGI